MLRARARPGPLAGAELEEALAEGAATGWVQPFLGHGPAVTAELSRLPLDDLHPALADVLRPAAAPQGRTPLVEQLTPRERTVLELLPTHFSYAQIGEHLFLSVNTVKSNLKSLYRKLGVSSRSEAVGAMDLSAVVRFVAGPAATNLTAAGKTRVRPGRRRAPRRRCSAPAVATGGGSRARPARCCRPGRAAARTCPGRPCRARW